MVVYICNSTPGKTTAGYIAKSQVKKKNKQINNGYPPLNYDSQDDSWSLASVPGGPAAAASSMSSPSSNSILLYSTSFSPDLRIDKIHCVQKTHNSHKGNAAVLEGELQLLLPHPTGERESCFPSCPLTLSHTEVCTYMCTGHILNEF